MGRAGTRPGVGRTALSLWSAIAVLCCLPVALLCIDSPGVADSALLGSLGTALVLIAVSIAAVAGAWANWAASTSGQARRVVGFLLVVAVVATVALAIGFFTGSYAILGVLLLQSAVFTGLLARGTLNAARGVDLRRG